ncbi:MAG: M20/M25/M40 family metallo-hydrolase [Acidimicrobiales bacterium]
MAQPASPPASRRARGTSSPCAATCAHPEPSWEEEHRTTEVLVERLRRAGLAAEDRPSGTAPSATSAPKARSWPSGPTSTPCASTTPRRCRTDPRCPACAACGHDVHTAAALGAGLAVHDELEHRPGPGRVRLIFQPAEESVPGGASTLLEAGVVDGVEVVYALHADPVAPGRVDRRQRRAHHLGGDQLCIRLHGPGGHTGRPHETADLAHIAARVAVELPMTLGRLSDPRDGLNLTFGSIQVGSAANVIATEATLLGSLRASGKRLQGGRARPPPAHHRLDRRAARRHLGARAPGGNAAHPQRPLGGRAGAARRPRPPRASTTSAPPPRAPGRGLLLVRRAGEARLLRLGVWDPAGLPRRPCTPAPSTSTSGPSASGPRCWPAPRCALI